jgi:hypothetical protein
VANKLYKKSLLNTVCLVAGVSIFFFGYDQGLMAGVNTAKNYAELMGFGHYDEQTKLVVVDKPLLQGGIVSSLDDSMTLHIVHGIPNDCSGSCVLPTRHSCRESHWWLAW